MLYMLHCDLVLMCMQGIPFPSNFIRFLKTHIIHRTISDQLGDVSVPQQQQEDDDDEEEEETPKASTSGESMGPPAGKKKKRKSVEEVHTYSLIW